MNEFFRIVSGTAELTESKAERIYNTLIITMLGTMGLLLVMWAINAYWMKEINFFFFFLGGILLLVMGFTPRVVGMSAVAGLAVNGLQDKDLSQGTVSGVKVLYKVVTGILFGFWVVAGLLATWSFKEAPMAFWPVATMAIVIGIVIEFFEMKGGVFKWVVIIYAVGVILVAFWQTLPSGVKSMFVTTNEATLDEWIITKVPVGCGLKFSHDSALYQVEYRFYDTAWHEYKVGTSPNASEVRYKALTNGLVRMPVRVTCS